jgi:hypothetical protein
MSEGVVRILWTLYAVGAIAAIKPIAALKVVVSGLAPSPTKRS